MTNHTTLSGAFSAAADTLRRLDIVHFHAGVQVAGRPEDVSVYAMNGSRALNVPSHFIFAQAALPQMRARCGRRIIIIPSNSGDPYDRAMIA